MISMEEPVEPDRMTFLTKSSLPIEPPTSAGLLDLNTTSPFWSRTSMAELRELLTLSWAWPMVHLSIRNVPMKHEINVVIEITAMKFLSSCDFSVFLTGIVPLPLPPHHGVGH